MIPGHRCIWCGNVVDRADHLKYCDGKQGHIEAAIVEPPAEPEPPFIVITKPRHTSVEAFYRALDAGVINTRRLQAYAGLAELGIATVSETFEHLKDTRQLTIRYDSNTATRFSELRDLGLIREVGERPCRVTGQTCITWAVVRASEYAGPATLKRCPTCGQIVSRVVPTVKT
jgi:hypothetical protein